MANKSLGKRVLGRSAKREETIDYLLSLLIKGLTPKSSAPHTDIEKAIKNIALRNNVNDLEFFKKTEGICRDFINGESRKSDASTGKILLSHIANYYESIGFFEKSLELNHEALATAIEDGDVSLERSTHNRLGVIYIRSCDFARACAHIEKAYRIASKQGNLFHAFATLVNAVAALEEMGLYREACELAVKISDQPTSDSYFSHLHLINTNNGMRICHVISDMKMAEIFSEISKREMLNCEHLVNQVARAHFDVAQIGHLVRKGLLEDALEKVKAIEVRNQGIDNIKISALFQCAKTEVCVALQDQVRIAECCGALDVLLGEARNSFTHYEEILRLLVYVYSNDNVELPNKQLKHLKYLRLLREHVVSVKHRIFFSKNAPKSQSGDNSGEVLANPNYQIPRWIREVINEGFDNIDTYKVTEIRFAAQLDILPRALASIAGGRAELPLRSARYDIAENWSVAAEFAAGFDGRHGFRVGRLSRAIALKMGLSAEKSVMLELACRLHDIGKIAFVFVPNEGKPLRALGQFSMLCNHTILGARILELSTEEVLICGAVVAQSHHESWNGCGYPVGLKGLAIPLEGRICAVAEAFVSLVCPPYNEKGAWTIQCAFDQLRVMAGMQLDPTLVFLLVDLMEGEGPSTLKSDIYDVEYGDTELLKT